MNKITIEGIEYTLVARRKRLITMADSFVAPSNKTGGGNGEAKLYMGQDDDPTLREFYGKRPFKNQCIFSRENLIKYLYDAKNEYFHPTQSYRKRINMPALWEERFRIVENHQEWIPFTIYEKEKITPPRIYTGSEDKAFTLMRQLALPNLSKLSVSKYRNEKGEEIYLYNLYFYSSVREAEEADRIQEHENTEDKDSSVSDMIFRLFEETNTEEEKKKDAENIAADSSKPLIWYSDPDDMLEAENPYYPDPEELYEDEVMPYVDDDTFGDDFYMDDDGYNYSETVYLDNEGNIIDEDDIKYNYDVSAQPGDILTGIESEEYNKEQKKKHSVKVVSEEEFISATDVEEEPEEDQHPYNTEKISIEKKTITMDACIRRLEQGTIILDPDFQRNEVWNLSKKSRLIESLMLKIPIPMFYVSADEKGNYSVVDGLQRLSSIRDFVLGQNYLSEENSGLKVPLRGKGFTLRDLEFWGEKYNGATFSDLPVEIQNRILETEFTFTVINPGTPEDVKRNVFKRLNTGGEPLTAQEIRNALYGGESTKFLKKLSVTSEFRNATYYSVRSDRMADKELVLRALAFMVRSYEKYPRNNDMDKFLSDTMRILNLPPDLSDKQSEKFFLTEKNRREGVRREDIRITDPETLEKMFREGQHRTWRLFGKHAFRKSYAGKRRTPINKALFEVWTVLLGQLTDVQFEKLRQKRTDLLRIYRKLLINNTFNYIISRDSLKATSVTRRYEILSTLINNILSDDPEAQITGI